MPRNFNRRIVPLKGSGKPSELYEGELAISTVAEQESLYTKNSEGEIVKLDFSNYTILTKEQYEELEYKDPTNIYFILSGGEPETKVVITFEDEDGTIISIKEYNKGEEVIPPTPPEREGETFIRWDKTVETATKDETYVAVYEKNKYIVIFEDYDGRVISETEYEYKSTVIPPSDPIRVGYIFVDWGEPIVPVVENKTYTAHYKKEEELQVTVDQVIEEGYARIVTQSDDSHGYAIEILSTCPYKMSQITDFDDILTSTKLISEAQGSTDNYNTFIWRELPENWSVQELADKYTNNTLNTRAIGGLFGQGGYGVNFNSVNSMTVTYGKETSWQLACGYPWGSFNNTAGWNLFGGVDNGPKELTLHFKSGTSSVAQRIFQHLRSTEKINIICDGDFKCHDFAGCFEGCRNLKEINLEGKWYWNGMDNRVNYSHMFHECFNLKRIPLSPLSNDREAECNTLKPIIIGDRGSNVFNLTFEGCVSLESIEPTIDATQLIRTDAISFETPNLTDVHFKGLNNCNWSFVDSLMYIPNMSVESIEYALNNIGDCGDNHYIIKFAALHKNEVSQTAIDNAINKGWTVEFGEAAYKHTFEGWTINTNALADYELLDDGHTLSISKFKPNTWLMKMTPEVEEGSTIGDAVYDYLENFEVVLNGFTNQTGEGKKIDWVKTNNDAGGYFAKGVVLSAIWNMWGDPNKFVVTTYPWDCGVPSGYLKNPNDGWSRYGYSQDGLNNLYDTTNRPYKESVTGLGIGLYSGTEVDSDGYITLDTPIKIQNRAF